MPSRTSDDTGVVVGKAVADYDLAHLYELER
jgi:hypothetical protein